jgi:hypothetical protein
LVKRRSIRILSFLVLASAAPLPRDNIVPSGNTTWVRAASFACFVCMETQRYETLYIVARLTVKPKYSLNVAFFPLSTGRFGEKIYDTGNPGNDGLETRVTQTSCLKFYDLISPETRLITPPPQRVPIKWKGGDSVKCWFQTDLRTLDIVCGGCGKRGECLNAEKSAGCAISLKRCARAFPTGEGKS